MDIERDNTQTIFIPQLYCFPFKILLDFFLFLVGSLYFLNTRFCFFYMNFVFFLFCLHGMCIIKIENMKQCIEIPLEKFFKKKLLQSFFPSFFSWHG